MAIGTTTARLALAALVSGAAAGLLMALAILLALMLLGRGWNWEPSTAALLALLAAGLAAGLVVATLPAFLAGAAMCALGRRVETARGASAWAAAGAAVGALCWAVFAVGAGMFVGEPGLTGPGGTLIAAIMVGAGAALSFRAVVRPARGDSA